MTVERCNAIAKQIVDAWIVMCAMKYPPFYYQERMTLLEHLVAEALLTTAKEAEATNAD